MRISALALALAVTGGAAHAQDVYVGVALDYGQPHSGDTQSVASLMVGGAFDMGTMSVGVEAEYGAAASFGGDYDTARLRLLGGYDLGSVTALASIGATSYDLGATSASGYNVGLGVQMPVNNALDVRAEFIRDFMDDYGTDVTTTRIAAVYSF